LLILAAPAAVYIVSACCTKASFHPITILSTCRQPEWAHCFAHIFKQGPQRRRHHRYLLLIGIVKTES